jgi:hypothetical protein
VSIAQKTTAIASEPDNEGPREHVVGREEVLLDAYEALEINVAMWDFAQRLPLDELSAIGQGLAPLSPRKECEEAVTNVHPHVLLESLTESPTKSRTLSLTSSSSSSSWSFACCSARRIERDHVGRENVDEENISSEEFEQDDDAGVTKDQSLGPRTLSLTTTSSSSSWSFACRSTRRVERDHTPQKRDVVDPDLKEDSRNPQSTIVFHTFNHPQRNTFYRPVRCSTSHEASNNPPCALDGEGESGPTLIWPTIHTKRRPCFTRRSIDSADLFLWSIGIRISGVNHTRMSDEEFANLPDWSDVEDDPEYNMVEERLFCWSDAASSCSFR